MPNEPEKNQMPTNKATIHTTHQLPIDLANKVIVKPANDKMSIQSTTFRTIQQPPQMRVVRMPGTGGTGAQIIQTQIMPQTILKPSIPGRSTITVSKSPATYLPRVTATLNTIQGAKGTQQIRTPTPPTSVAGISPAFVRAMTPRTSSPNAVLSQGTAWVSGAVQVPQQLLRSTITQNRTFTANIFGQTAQNQNSTVSVSTSTSGTSGQPTYVATVLPQRQPGATIVYTSQQQQPFLQGQMQRMGIATATANTRQIRPIQRIGGTTGIRVNTSTLSIRQNVPGLAPTSQVLSSQNRNTTGMTSSTTISNTIPARIFQVQPQQGSGPQVIGQSNSKILSANVMLPIIVGNQRITHSVKNPLQQGIIAHVSKLTSGTVSSDGTMISTLTNTMPSVSNTIQQATIQATQSVQVSQGNQQQTIYTTQTPQQVTNIGNQSGNQIITVSQQQQLLSNQQGNIHQGGNIQTVVPLALGSRTGNIPIKTITVSTSNSGSMDNTVTVHRSLPSNAGNLQATTIMPIAKLVSQQQMVNQQHQQNLASGQGTPVYIHTRIPAASTVASSAQSQMISTISSSSTPSYSSAPTTTVYYEQASLSTSSGSDNKTSSTSVNDYSVGSTANIRYSSDKLIHSIIANSFQNQNAQNTSHMQQQQSSAVQQQSVPIRFSPLVVEGQSGQQGQQTSHQIITMGTSNIVQQQGPSGSETPTHMIVPLSSQVPTSPRGAGSILRKHNETTPQKGVKKQPKVKNYQVITEPLQTRVQPRQPIAAGVAQLTQNLKPIEVKQPSVASSPKTTFSERESPSHVDEWSDGSTTVSIPNSPRSEDDDLDAMIQFNKIGEEFAKLNKIGEEFAKFNKTPIKLGGGMKRDAGDHPMTPRSVKKIKLDRDAVDSAVDANNENNAESANTKKKDVVLKKPQASLLQTYNQSSKTAHNHFLRYSDVKVRDDRRTSVMDLANQPKVVQRVNGWKTHMICAEFEEMIKDESQEVDKLNEVLKRLESSESTSEVNKVSELIKGSMQRSRLIIDSFNDSKTQLVKIFDHKDHAADIITRCASKRNFKKR